MRLVGGVELVDVLSFLAAGLFEIGAAGIAAGKPSGDNSESAGVSQAGRGLALTHLLYYGGNDTALTDGDITGVTAKSTSNKGQNWDD